MSEWIDNIIIIKHSLPYEEQFCNWGIHTEVTNHLSALMTNEKDAYVQSSRSCSTENDLYPSCVWVGESTTLESYCLPIIPVRILLRFNFSGKHQRILEKSVKSRNLKVKSLDENMYSYLIGWLVECIQWNVNSLAVWYAEVMARQSCSVNKSIVWVMSFYLFFFFMQRKSDNFFFATLQNGLDYSPTPFEDIWASGLGVIR